MRVSLQSMTNRTSNGAPGMCFPVPFCILQGAGCRESQVQDCVHGVTKGEEQNGVTVALPTAAAI